MVLVAPSAGNTPGAQIGLGASLPLSGGFRSSATNFDKRRRRRRSQQTRKRKKQIHFLDQAKLHNMSRCHCELKSSQIVPKNPPCQTTLPNHKTTAAPDNDTKSSDFLPQMPQRHAPPLRVGHKLLHHHLHPLARRVVATAARAKEQVEAGRRVVTALGCGRDGRRDEGVVRAVEGVCGWLAVVSGQLNR